MRSLFLSVESKGLYKHEEDDFNEVKFKGSKEPFFIIDLLCLIDLLELSDYTLELF